MITPVLGSAGGMGRVAEEYADRMAKRGHEVVVFAPVIARERSDRSNDSLLGHCEEVQNFRRSNPENEKEWKLISLRPLFRYGHGAWIPQLAGMLRDFDVVHFHYPFLGGAGAVLRGMASLKHGIIKTKLVVSYHMDLVGKGLFHLFFRAYQKFVVGRVMRAADRVIVSSLDYATTGDLGPLMDKLNGKIIEIPFGVDTEYFQPISNSPTSPSTEHASAPLRFGGTEHSAGTRELEIGGEINFLFVGKLDRAHYFKGVSILLRAFAEVHRRHPTTRLNLVGSGDLMDTYRTEARALGIETATYFHGSVRFEDLPQHYARADCTVLPSTDRSEAFGLVLLEAQSCGSPVIASNLPGVRTTFEPQRTGLLVEPGSVSSLVDALLWMITHSEDRRAMGRSARTRIKDRYGWDTIIESLEKTYTGV